MTILGIFGLILALFFAFLAVKELTRLKFCVLCASVSAVWVGLLAAYLAGWWNDVILLAIFMGGSVVGVMYLLEKKLPQEFDMFRLPFYLSAVAVVWLVLVGSVEFRVMVFLAVLWLGFGAVYVLKNKLVAVKKIAERLAACCRDW